MIESLHVLHYHVCQYRCGVIAYHTPRLVASERPVRQHLLHALVVMGKQRVGHIGLDVLMYEVHQRMEGTISVPQ